MRSYLLTEQEKNTIKEYLETGKKLEGFKVIAYRARELKQKAILEDLKLIEEFLKKQKVK
jgi:hypothetical protein